MKVVILAGGLGSRLSEDTHLIPKPMVEIGGKPILWHIMKIYSHYGFNDFVILTGYKSHVIKEYFVNYYQQYSDITVDMLNNSVKIHRTQTEPWKIPKSGSYGRYLDHPQRKNNRQDGESQYPFRRCNLRRSGRKSPC